MIHLNVFQGTIRVAVILIHPPSFPLNKDNTMHKSTYTAIFGNTAARLLTRNMSKMRIGKKDAGGGEGIPYDAVTVTDILRVINGGDLPRHISLYNQSLDFFKWYLNEDVPEDLVSVDGSLLSLYDLEFLGRKWNEYIQIATEEE